MTIKPNRFDTVLAYANERAEKVRNHMTREFGKVKPFNTQLTPPIDILYAYDRVMLPENQDIRMQLIQAHGPETFAEFEKKALRSRGG